MNSDEFERQLRRQPWREVPAGWRAEILHSAQRAAAGTTAGRREKLVPAGATSWWRDLWWPCPQAWAGLAAVWIVIGALNLNGSPAKQVAKNDARAKTTIALAERRRDLSSLLDSLAPPAAVLHPRPPGPRSERPVYTVTV
jgi:hypothetical protein